MHKTVIIGGGLSGILLAIHLLRHRQCPATDITVIDINPPEKLGQAYSTREYQHLLNVPAAKMSAFTEDSHHFIAWLAATNLPFHQEMFVPRNIYRRYIQDILQQQLGMPDQQHRYQYIQGEAVDIVDGHTQVLLACGRHIPFDKLVLALGNFEAAPLSLSDNSYLEHPGYFASGWNRPELQQVPAGKRVFIIGTGLTMVDTVLSLRAQQHSGPVTALSTHGYVPMAHAAVPAYAWPKDELPTGNTLLEVFSKVNRQIKVAKARGIAWQAVIDAIRPYMQRIWTGFPVSEKKRFMVHVRHIWGVARHRMPPVCAAVIHELQERKQLHILAGRVQSIRQQADGALAVRYLERGSHQLQEVSTDIVINCMGPQSDYTRSKSPLIIQLLSRGIIRPDALRLGIDCTPAGAIIDCHGCPSDRLFTIGPPAKGALWEITAVPEIRAAAAQLAAMILTPNYEYVH
ncbi:FAD/NAD(P)-binding protein [Chitinophaga oryzae]|uniref:FAD/NAD(P)-binding protein n=1 Tax=Chitinophaga oryzae TaxID=2725414 RepID=A0AAE7D825_9BACT|nr:FAD/NAD(P)-binding protein [Chitinophaga oryzae]QJB31623.1 FAD/NAD(P)-binding protein [Chitinophaga oryzae]